ncbi:septum site-determining protein MinC [Pseudaminobacter sp. 19-2017]|uniref:Probable septum site-determining protein MinC n=1 Tax=Pseudaminobacter soli (ex Zhang et al. 2022) TaxID=2831468 RepID=A0A942E420_9HYPH|nr:septum site-determining protein MinC [Pseudaminobacter soli]MBS3650740.1 septum site-determining protein MinC [Pseudaminobacter soli]
MTETLTDTRPIRLKGRSFLALMLTPELPIEGWLARLDDLAARSAGFFLGRPVVLDVEDLDITKAQLQELIAQLGQRNVWIMGIEGARPSLLGPGMPPAMKGGRPGPDFEPPAPEEAAAADAPADLRPAAGEKPPQLTPVTEPQPSRATHSIIITEPVRSGQSVIYPEGDVTILGSVASGAEVIAGGSIHIYGALRGRALAGSVGNTSARIFCRKLEAELLAIDGLYKTAEDMDKRLRGQAVQFWLEGDSIMAEALS